MTPVPPDALDLFAEAPSLALAARTRTPSRIFPGVGIGAEAKSHAREFLRTFEPAVAGEEGNRRTYIASRIAWNDFGLPEADAWDLLLEYNRTCQPPWQEHDLQKIFHSAVKHGPSGNGRGWRLHKPHVSSVSRLAATPTADENLVHIEATEGAVHNIQSNRWRFVPMSSVAFAAGNFHAEWYITRILVKGQPAVVAGPPKALKTSLLIDMAVSLASGTKFLGEFEVPGRKRVCFLSGESGQATMQETALRICKARVVKLQDLDLYWLCDLPQLAKIEDLVELERGLEEYAADVLILDPLYLTLLSGGASSVDERSLYQMGNHLREVSRVCGRVGTTPIFAHHANRGLKRGETMELQHLSYAGIAEFARQWVLLNRTKAYEGDGVHDLTMSFGGSAGQGGVWSVRIEEGVAQADFTSRSWVVRALPASDAREITKQKKEIEKENEQRAKRLAQDTKVLSAVENICKSSEAATKTQISAQTGCSPKIVNEIVARLLEWKSIECVSFEKITGKGTKPKQYEGYRRTGQDSVCAGQEKSVANSSESSR